MTYSFFSVDGLAPGETYDFFVKAIGKDYVGLESMLTRLTKGRFSIL